MGVVGAQMVDVEVDPETGHVKILRFTASQDVGRAIHPAYVEGQIQGGVAQGIGWALNEEFIYDKNGRLDNAGFLDYRMPVASDLPPIDAVMVTRIGNNVFVGPSVSLTNDPFPPSEKLVGVTIKDNAIIGSRAVIKAGVTVGENSVVAMGAVVTKDVPMNTVVGGVPAKVMYSKEEYDKKQLDWKNSN